MSRSYACIVTRAANAGAHDAMLAQARGGDEEDNGEHVAVADGARGCGRGRCWRQWRWRPRRARVPARVSQVHAGRHPHHRVRLHAQHQTWLILILCAQIL